MFRSFRCEIRTRQIMTNKNILRTALLVSLALWHMPTLTLHASGEGTSDGSRQPLGNDR